MDAKKEFADLKFKAECNDMVLTRVGNPQLVIRGPGEIWQDTNGVLQFKIFATQQAYQTLRAYMGRPGVIGQIIPDEDFFTLRAQEHILPRWTAARILPSSRGGPIDGLAHGFINELVHTEEAPTNPEADFVSVRFKGKWDFPCNEGTETIIRVAGQERQTSSSLNVALIAEGDYRFEVRQEGEHTILSLQLPHGELTPATPSRLHEALQFVLGRQLSVMVIETTAGGQQTTRLISPPTDRGEGRMNPPLEFCGFDEGGHIWRMFVLYFRHVHSNPEPGWHPISRHVGSAIESTAASLEAEILALAVAVEGLVGACFPTLAPVSPDFLAELDAVNTALATVQMTNQTKKRVSGTIDQMRKPRNSDLLRVFVANNRLPNGLIKSWSSLRNSSAHGGGDGGREVERTSRLRSEVLSLLYSIVFAAINYTGPRTEYSLPGWPTRAWPIPQGPAAAPAPAAGPPPATVPRLPNQPAPLTVLPAQNLPATLPPAAK